jgi:enoyl-CoA hydratase/carnithine racemase
MTQHVTTEMDHGVLIVRLKRVEKMNALTMRMYGDMAAAIDRAEADRAVRVLLIAGSGGVFTAGNDLGDFLENPPHDPDSPVHRFIGKIVSTDVPIVAAVDGFAVGIGTTMLLHFDQVVATKRARFSLPFIKLGLVPEAGSSMLLAQECGYRKAAELLLLGEPFSSAEALQFGIVSQLCETDELMEQALAIAYKLAANPSGALRATKKLMKRPQEPLAHRILAETEAFSKRLASPAAKEAMTAFMEKRAPDFDQLD